MNYASNTMYRIFDARGAQPRHVLGIWDSDLLSAREALERAILRAEVTEPGRYIVARIGADSMRLTELQYFTVEPEPRPPLRIA